MDQIERKKIEQIKKWTKLKKFFFLKSKEKKKKKIWTNAQN